MTQFLPPNLLTLFAARDPLPYLPPVTPLTHEKRTVGYGGVSDYLKFFEDPKDTPPPTKYETRDERLERKRKAKQEQVLYKIELDIVNCVYCFIQFLNELNFVLASGLLILFNFQGTQTRQKSVPPIHFGHFLWADL